MRFGRLVLRTFGGLWSLAMVLLTVASLILSMAMAIFPQVLGAVSAVAETVTGRKSVVTQARTREAHLSDQLGKARRDLDVERVESRSLRRQMTALSENAMDAPVAYRGGRMTLRQAVHDTAERVSHRAGVAATRNVGSTFGEALPVIGVGVVVAATAWELHDSCQMMKEMRELDAAFNPDQPMSADEVCGVKPPSRAEVWQVVRSSPGKALEGAENFYDDLPDVSISASYRWTVGKMASFWNDDAVQIDDGNEAPSDWNPFN